MSGILTLSDLTAGGFNSLTGEQLRLLNQQTFLDEAAHGWFNLSEGLTYLNGWVS